MNLERQLLAKNDGWPETSDFWKRAIEDATSETFIRQVTVRAGRRAGKSTTLCRVLVCEALYGDWKIPAGDKGYIPILSVNKNEAQRRLDTTEQILKALGFSKTRELNDESEMCEYSRSATELRILVRGRVIVWQVVAASRSATVGGTSIAALCDEVSRWRDSESGDNPAAEILASLRPSLLSVKGSKLWLISSPWSTVDIHAEEFDKGNTAGNRVYQCSTWEANPTITEQECRALESDPIVFDREFRAIPMKSGENILLDADLIDEAVEKFDLMGEVEAETSVHAGGDFGFVKNASALSIALRQKTDNLLRIQIKDIEFWQPQPGAPLRPSETIRTIAKSMKRQGASVLVGDLYYSETVREYLREEDLTLHAVARPDVVWMAIRKMLFAGTLSIPNDPLLIKELKGITFNPIPNASFSSPAAQTETMKAIDSSVFSSESNTPTQSPAVRISLPKQGNLHSDRAAALSCAVWSALQNIGGSFNIENLRLPQRRGEPQETRNFLVKDKFRDMKINPR